MHNGLELRVARIEQRLSRIERSLGVESEPTPVAPSAGALPRVVAATAPKPQPPAPPVPPAVAVEYLARPAPPPVPRAALEQTIGLKWAGWVGAVVLVIGAALGIKFAYDQGWLGGIAPTARLMLMSLGGFALIAGGEVVYRRVGRVASAGLYGAGVATLFLVGYAGHAYYELYARDTAFMFMAAATLIGAVVAMRAKLLSVAALALIGGNIAPLVIRGDSQLVTPLLTYLLALQLVALFLAWWGASSKWWILRTLSLITTALWTTQLMLAAPQAADGWDAPILFSILFGILYQLEMIISAARIARGGQQLAPRRLAGFSMIVTALVCAAGLYVWRDAADLARGAWVVGLAAAAAVIGFLLPRFEQALRDLGIGFRAQAAALLVVAAPVALAGPWIVIGWGALGLGFAILGAALDLSVSRRAAGAVWMLGILYLVAWTNFIDIRAAHQTWLTLLAGPIPAYAVLAAAMTVLGHAIAMLTRRGGDGAADAERAAAGVSALSGITLFVAALVALPPLGATLTLIAYASALAVAGRSFRLPNLTMQAAATITLATVKWVVIDTLADRLAPGWQPMLYRPVFNPMMGTGMLLAASMVGIAWSGRAELKRSFASRTGDAGFVGALVASVLLIVTIGLSFEIDRIVERASLSGVAMAFTPAQVRQLEWTMLWTAAASAGIGLHRLLARKLELHHDVPAWLLVLPIVLALKFLTIDTLGFRLSHAISGTLVLFNLQMLAAIVVVAGLTLSWYRGGQQETTANPLPGMLRLAIVFVLLWAASMEIDRAAAWLTRSGVLIAREAVVRQVGLSIFWSMYAVGCVAVGFRTRAAALRYFGLALFAVTLLKVVLIDLSQVATGYRVLSFMGLGLLLMGTSVLYGKLSPRLLRTA